MPAYLQIWTDGVEPARSLEGQPLTYAASNQYDSLGITAGDVLYIGYLEAGRLHLIGRLPVVKVINRSEAKRRFGRDIWEARRYAAARRHEADPAA